MVIYSITNLVNGKKYIGQTIQDVSVRWRRHKTGKFAIGNAIRKYGEDNFKIDILFNSFDRNYLNNAEKELIKNYNTMYPNGYNLMEGGQIRLTKEQRKKISVANTGRKETAKQTENRMKRIRKPVLCIEDQICFFSVKDAGEFYKVSPSHITKVCKGKLKRIKMKTFKHLTGRRLSLL